MNIKECEMIISFECECEGEGAGEMWISKEPDGRYQIGVTQHIFLSISDITLTLSEIKQIRDALVAYVKDDEACMI